jgi:hypothetical protein
MALSSRTAGPDVARCLDALGELTGHARDLGLDTDRADEVAGRARQRLGFPGGAFVLALAGGTGSGKSSLLNALAGEKVSRTGAVRPVTSEPVAWVPAAQAGELRGLLAWLGAARVVTHDDRRMPGLCLLDLPDYDSVEVAHRAVVDEVLPKVDALCWVLDPEKYNDRILHEDYLRPLAHQAGRAVFVLNRADTLGPPEVVGAVVADVRASLEADGITGRPVFAVAAAPADGDHRELDRLREWLAERMEAKAVVTGRLAAECLDAGEALARQAGVEGAKAAALVATGTRGAARDRAVAAARAAVDVDGVRSACVRRVRAEAKAVGGGPLGRVIGWAVRRRQGGGADPDRSVDPVAYAQGWRRRATLARAVNPVRELARQAAAAAPPALRPAVMRRAGPERLEQRLSSAVDDGVNGAVAGLTAPPRSLLWPLIGFLQVVCLAAVLVGVLWLATLYFAGQAGADLPGLPAIQGVPLPVVLVGGGAILGIVLSRVLDLNAVMVGQRWARRLTKALDRRVEAEVDEVTRDPMAELESTRTRLGAALADLRAAAGG